MAASTECSQIAKFDGSNFQLWKFSVTIILKAEKLLNIVNSSEVKPEADADNAAALTNWEDKNAKAQVILLSTITQD